MNATCAVTWPASRPPVRIWIRAERGTLIVLVWDACATEPLPAHAAADDESGRGLLLIHAFSHSGLYHPPGDGAGKVIWAQFPKQRDKPIASAT